MRFSPDKHLHSKEHLLADDLSREMREPKRFAAYLGIAKLYYESDLRALARYVLEKEDLPLEARGKYFFASLKGLQKKPMVKFKRKKKPASAKAFADAKALTNKSAGKPSSVQATAGKGKTNGKLTRNSQRTK